MSHDATADSESNLLPATDALPLDWTALDLIDSHCHFDDPRLTGAQQDRLPTGSSRLWQQCRQAGLAQLLIPATEPAGWAAIRELAAANPGIYWAAGLHPWRVATAQITPAQLPALLQAQLADSRCVAVGECGLDGGIATDMTLQESFLREQLALAADTGYPLVLHAHRGHARLQPLLKKFRFTGGGVIHGFAGSPELARSYWTMGFHLGIGGTITYPRASKTRAAVQSLPLQALLLETDAPDMPLAGFQGQANSPLQLARVAACLAELRGESVAQIARQTAANSRRLFRLTEPEDC